MPSASSSDASDRLSWTRLPGGTFARHVMTLASGTAVGQVLLVLSLPVLTRLYSPADYGALAVYASTVTVLLVVASLRFELAIPLPEDDRVAGSLLALSLLSLAVVTTLVGVLVWLAGDALVARAKVPALQPYLWLIPIGLAGAGVFQALSYWAIRRRAFSRIARAKVSQGIGQVAVQIGLGVARAGAPGLLIGDVVGRVAGGGGVSLLALRDRAFATVTRGSITAAALRYRRFPLLMTPSGLLNIGSLQLPSILFAAGFGAAAAGLYALSYKMLVLPTMLVAQAVGQVFLSRAAAVSTEPARLRALADRTALALFAGGLPLFCTVAIGGPELVATIMGAQWYQAGRYAQILAPWFALWLVSNPLSGLLSVREWQGSALAFTAVEFGLRLGSLLIGIHHGSPILAVALLSASGVAIAAASIARFMHAGHSSLRRLVGPAARVLLLALGCLLPAVVALRSGHHQLALAAGMAAIAVYYLVLVRSTLGSRLLAADAGRAGRP